MQYALLIYQDAAFEEFWANANDDQRREMYAGYTKFGEMLAERGAMVGGDELVLSATATTVRGQGGDAVVTDGPFAEVAERSAATTS